MIILALCTTQGLSACHVTQRSRGILHRPEGEMVDVPDIFTCVEEKSLRKIYITKKKERKLSIGVLSAKYHIDY